MGTTTVPGNADSTVPKNCFIVVLVENLVIAGKMTSLYGALRVAVRSIRSTETHAERYTSLGFQDTSSCYHRVTPVFRAKTPGLIKIGRS